MAKSVLVLHDLTKRYGALAAVDRVALEVREGELLALVGPSGCGKTTALHLIAGLLAPDQGDIVFNGESWRDRRPADRNVALVFQDGALYPHLTVAENLAFPLRARRRHDDTAVDRIAQRLELTELLHRFPDELSGGESQRVALGRALIRQPNLLLLDEPLTSLDLPLRERLRGLVRDLVAEIGVTTIFVTHDQGEAMAVGDRVAVMRSGRLMQIDASQEIYDHPRHEFVGRFFGTPPMNMLRGRGEAGRIVGPWGSLPAPERTAGREVLCGFRAEAASVHEDDKGLPGELVRVEPQGPIKIATVRLPDHEVRLRLHRDKNLPSVGSAVTLVVDAEDLHYFDAVSGDRL
ncbi:MAG: ABC transporter ATP-binding protein [Candidatus Lernaella stagnicola]|nr:ABC transporter ATP-binding protein [Candidatus Lernaella stagnicola]